MWSLMWLFGWDVTGMGFASMRPWGAIITTLPPSLTLGLSECSDCIGVMAAMAGHWVFMAVSMAAAWPLGSNSAVFSTPAAGCSGGATVCAGMAWFSMAAEKQYSRTV